ncbi:MAG: hypothetical protein Q8Q88_13525 [Phenylobacterium sp.]|uniref:hypothetical protein n=1 Tax=Phenylobacterium sp. TaxID=1871053 RepID=UPI002734B4CD|nr:hypothetical protein [Phenylobacterium sp.]MDP3748057.1 hypothetical protein [Phenylobacterium sp.]
MAVVATAAPAAAATDGAKPPALAAGAPRDGARDFDFEFGVWNTHLTRRLRPLTGSTTWVDYQGVTTVRPVLGGAANLVELEVKGPAGEIKAISLRLYEPAARHWTLNFANGQDGLLTSPMTGEFKDGVGTFYDQDTLNGRAILVRFVISCAKPTVCRFEQAFSDDGGKAWEVNWIATDTRVSATVPAA